jgi:hypothetical protein
MNTDSKYCKILQYPDKVFHLLYSDRTKTAEILGEKDFINAWLESKKQIEITNIIRKEARNGDIPSLKQMVWFLRIVYEQIPRPKNSSDLLRERILYNNILVSKGLLSHHYGAMCSSHSLFYELERKKANFTERQELINAMLQHAQEVIKLGKDHPSFDGDMGFINDAENIINNDYFRLLNRVPASLFSTP